MFVVMKKLYLLILSARHLLEKVWHTLALWNVKAEALEEVQALSTRPMVEDVTCRAHKINE